MILLVVGHPGDSSKLNEKHLESEKGKRIRLPLEKVHSFDTFTDQIKPQPK
ncbi:hypothetical protein SDC9_58698 [bioreactor metagenome]|jgi:hypothetical protein|uniref:Uncharacterized protein n=1 Tax=bioreactor metagenome TaxID=1076179 RepID=A0A644X846_9ZZZZ